MILTKSNALAMFALAGMPVTEITQTENLYSKDEADASPWWKVQTPVGTIVIGWRKRVINIDWTDTSVRHIVTEDRVTKSETNVHAWSVGKAVDYLAALQRHIAEEADDQE